MESKIKVTHVYPPIACRNFDYVATRDNYDEGDPVGYGSTEQQAIDDLLEQEDE